MAGGEDMGFKFGKYDLERMGVFSEMSYISVGDKYKLPAQGASRDLAKGRQMYPGYPKSKSGRQDGYFSDKFLRVFEGDYKYRPVRAASPGLFIPSGVTKKHACPGDFHGTFAGIVPAIDPRPKKKPPYEREPRNVQTKPGKKGGPGYVDITFSRYPEYRSDKYDTTIRLYRENVLKHKERNVSSQPFKSAISPQKYFDKNPFYTEKPVPTYRRDTVLIKTLGQRTFLPSSPGKKDGGCKHGTFSKFPEYQTPRRPRKPFEPRVTKIFRPQGVLKSTRIRSVVNYNVDFKVNVTNWTRYKPVVYKRVV